MDIAAIKTTLRESNDDELNARRKIILLSSLGLIDFSIISLYQTGVIRKLPDLPFKVFNSNKVNASSSAYMMGVPDGPVSAGVYALTMMLASAGGTKRSGRKRIFDLLLGGAILANAAGAAYYLYDMIFKQKKACIYCLAGAAINFTSAGIVAPLLRKRLREV